MKNTDGYGNTAVRVDERRFQSSNTVVSRKMSLTHWGCIVDDHSGVLNDDFLDDDRINLDIRLDEPILVVGDNFSQAESLIRKYKLGKPTGRLGQSGYCTYPEYKFDMNEIRKYCINPQDIPETENKPKAKGAQR